jgi:ribonuclease HI
MAEVIPWKLFFDGLVCSKGQGIDCVLVSPHGMQYELFVRLEFMCANNQAEYEGLLHGLAFLRDIGSCWWRLIISLNGLRPCCCET